MTVPPIGKPASALRHQLSVSLGLLQAGLLLLFSVFVFVAARSYLYAELDRHLHRDAEAVQQALTWDGAADWRIRKIQHAADDPFDTEPHFEVWSPSGKELYHSAMPDGPNADLIAGSQTLAPPSASQRTYFSTRVRDVSLRVGIEPMQLSGSAGPQQVLLRVYRSEADLQLQLRALALGLVAATLMVVALGAALSAWLALRALRPLGKLVAHVEEVGQRPLAAQVASLARSGGSAEVNALGISFAQMLARLEASYAQLDGFAADCAHELRTPLAALRARGESLLAGSAAPNPATAVAEMLESIDRMTVLINRLLSLARAESKTQTLHLKTLNLTLAGRQTADVLLPVLEESGQTLTVDGSALWARADAVWLDHIVMDLLHNSARYAPRGSRVRLRVWQDGPEAVLSIEDQGAGLSAAVRQRTGIELVNAQTSRQADATPAVMHPDSTCLGLVIAARLTRLQGGRLTARVLGDAGHAVDVRLPVAPVQPG